MSSGTSKGVAPVLVGMILVAAAANAVQAEEEKLVDIPIIFSSDGHELTSACLEIKEKVYSPEHAPWERFKRIAQDSPEKSLAETITAMQHKDRARLKELSHPVFGRDQKIFEEQASAYISQLQSLRIDNVRSYFTFDDLVVFFVQLTGNDKLFFATFLFMHDGDRNLGFLQKSDSFALALTKDWFQSDWGPAKSASPSYCEPTLLKGMTHRVVLGKGNRSDSAAVLRLVGRNLADVDQISNPYTDVLDHIKKMQEALRSGRLDEYFDGFTEKGKKKHRDWFLAEEEERPRTKYIDNFVAQKPFFVFNADPMFVVYTRGASSPVIVLHTQEGPSDVQVLYFVRNREGQFKLTGESVGSAFDRIFKSEEFIGAASQEKPFEGWRIPTGNEHSPAMAQPAQ